MSEATKNSARQLKLFHLENPLSARLGNEFFRALPVSPGVYFFYDSEGQLLYIGQSNNLRARIGSYRHVTPEKNPKRSLRLVSRIIRIEWEICETAEEAIKRESVLLLEHHPPFNRAGVWKGDPWWLKAEASDGVLHLELKREEDGFGPLPSAFRFIYGSLVRCLYRLNFPELCVSKYPHGIMDIRVPLELSLALPTSKETLQLLLACISGQPSALLEKLAVLPVSVSAMHEEYWQQEEEGIQKYATKHSERIQTLNGGLMVD